MSVLITGSNGFLASCLIDQISPFRSLAYMDRSPSRVERVGTFFQKEINGQADYSDCFDGVECIVHCAARVHLMKDSSEDPLYDYRDVNTYGTANLAKQAAKAGVKRFIFISSIKVNGENTNDGKPFTHESPRVPSDFYGQSKSEAEIELFKIASETSLEVVIIRPTLVYGSGVKANFASLMSLVGKGLPLPFGCVTSNKRSLVSVMNLVDLISVCIDHPNAANEVFLVSDDNDLSTREMINQMSKAQSKNLIQLPVPVFLFKSVGALLGKKDIVDRLVGSLQVDISHTKETLNWLPPQSVESGFKETAKYLQELEQ